MTNSVEKDDILSSETVCKTSLEALQSPVAERVLYLALRETLDEFEFRDDDVAKIMIIFTKIIQGEDILDNEITFFQGVLENKDFQKAYYWVLNKIKFKDVSFEELANLKEKISFRNLSVMIHKLIVKNKVSFALSRWETINCTTVNLIDKKYSNYTEIEGKIYEKIWENVFKTTLDEEVKIFIKNNWTLEEIEWIEDAEKIFIAETNLEWLENIVALHYWNWMCWISIRLRYLYNLNTKKIFEIPSIIGYIEREWEKKEWEKIKYDRKWRIYIKMFNDDSILFDTNNMEIVGRDVIKSFDFNYKEYYIRKSRSGSISLRCVWDELSIPISNWNLDNIIIDEKKWIVKYRWIFWTKFGWITIDLSKL
ncbi:MAG: hypothetical protein ACD_49C00067G0057 [uncultured bacterium (gcode 4)]|uniref:Uncharacterized protein n=1 Tax=uncultured bacterium (gcode 4) TaxID=1234023 RepID=K2AWJ6_9BACT|nr:MAG: hypothetical protein ACD_49C00067G0057 [uncultured bacterium (gcode 4)]